MERARSVMIRPASLNWRHTRLNLLFWKSHTLNLVHLKGTSSLPLILLCPFTVLIKKFQPSSMISQNTNHALFRTVWTVQIRVSSIEDQITFSGVLLQMVVIFYKAHLNRVANVSSVQKEKALLSFEANVERQFKY